MILHWALTDGLAFGSFERYLVQMAHRLADYDTPMTLVIGDGLCEETRAAFNSTPLKLITLPINELEKATTLCRIHAEEQPALTHFHFVSFGGELAAAAGELSSATVLTDHASTTSSEHMLRGIYRSTRKLRQQRSEDINHIIAVSNYVRQRVLRWQNAAPKQVTTIYNGIDLDNFTPKSDQERQAARRALTARKDGPYWVAFVGQLTREKGLHTFLNTSLRLRNRDATFLIIGDGPLREKVEQATNDQPNLIYLGRRSDVADLLPLMDLLVTPSHMQEAFGLVAAEALACGVPALVANTGGLPEVVGPDQQCGRMTRQTSSRQMAQDIKRLKTVKDQAALRHAARQRAENLFGLKTQIDRTLAIYNKYLPHPLLAKSPHPRQYHLEDAGN